MSITPDFHAPCLRDWQRAFQSSVVNQDPSSDVSHHIARKRGINSRQRLEVYVQAYAMRLLEIMQGDYPALRKTLGEQRFDALARTYIAEHPSTTHSVRWFGGPFSQFLRGHRTRPAWAAELAQFEWALGEVLDAADATAMPGEAMSDIPAEQWPTLTLKLVPSVRLLRLAWNVPDLLQAAEADPATAIRPIRGERAQWCLLWRHQLEARWRKLDRAEAWALRVLQRGKPLAQVSSSLQHAGVPNRQVPAQLVTCLQQWLGDSLICKLDNGDLHPCNACV